MSPEKNNAMRLLDARGIPYRTYDFSPTIHSAEGVAEALGVPLRIVYKSLVVMPAEGRPLLVLVPGDHELSLHRLAGSLGLKKLRMATKQEAEKLTGLQVGGISPLALLEKGWPIYLDWSAMELEELLVSAGRRGTNLLLRVADLLAVTGAEWIEAAEE